MVRINVYMTLDDDEAARFESDADLESSIKARLDEFYDGDGNPVFPHVLGIDVEED